MEILSLALIVLGISIYLTFLIIKIMLQNRILDMPKERGSHTIPTPRSGGLSFVFLSLIIFIVYAYLNKLPLPLFLALLGGIPISIVGLMDDIFSVKARWRALVHLTSSLWVIYWIGFFFPFTHSAFYLEVICFFLTIISLVWCTNLYNFMDGIDGLAGLEGLFLTSITALAFDIEASYNMSSLFLLLSAAIGGFCFWNWPPAKIFMGDTGSCYLGFIFSVFALYSMKYFQLNLYFWIIIGAIFICDTTLTLLYRIYQKKCWYEAHHDHAYQALLNYGLSHKNVSLGALLINICILAPNAFLELYSSWKLAILLISLLEIIFIWFLFTKLKLVFEKNNSK